MASHSPLGLRILLFIPCAFLAALPFDPGARGQESPKINGHAIDPEQYHQLVKHGFLPTRTKFLSNEDIARKFDLSLPQMGNIKAALEKNESAALEKALIAYLNGKLPALTPANPPK